MTREEEIMHAAWEKYCGDPAYKFTQEECVAVSVCLGRELLLRTPLAILPDDDPIEASQTIDSLNPYLQKNIRRSEPELVEAMKSGRFVEMLESCGLREDRVAPSVVKTCLCELQISREMSQQTFDQYPHPDGEKYDHNAPTVREQAESLGLTLTQPDLERGQYVGTMAGHDYQGALIKFATGKAIELPFLWLAAGQARPKMGETVRMKFMKGELLVSVEVRKGKPLE